MRACCIYTCPCKSQAHALLRQYIINCMAHSKLMSMRELIHGPLFVIQPRTHRSILCSKSATGHTRCQRKQLQHYACAARSAIHDPDLLSVVHKNEPITKLDSTVLSLHSKECGSMEGIIDRNIILLYDSAPSIIVIESKHKNHFAHAHTFRLQNVRYNNYKVLVVVMKWRKKHGASAVICAIVSGCMYVCVYV